MNQRKDINERYCNVMSAVRNQMNILGKIWSRLLHFPPINLLLDILDKTILRPVPFLVAGLASSIGGLGLFCIALYNGYSMAGSEIPLLFIGGLFVGIAFDYLRILFGEEL